jgi:hypothetical protein
MSNMSKSIPEGGFSAESALGSYAGTYAALLRPWLDKANPNSYTSLLLKCESELPPATAVYKTLPTNMLVAVWLVPGTADPFPPIATSPTPPLDMILGPWVAIAINPDGSITCRAFTDGNDVKHPGYQINKPSDRVPDDFDIPQWASTQGLQTQPWWPPERLSFWSPGRRTWAARYDIANTVIQIAETAAQRHLRHPARIEELKSTSKCLSELLNCCEELMPLAEHEFSPAES